MAKLEFSARKNPLLRPPDADRRPPPEPEPPSGHEDGGATAAADEPSVKPAADSAGAAPPDIGSLWAQRNQRAARNGRAVESPAGVVAVDPPPRKQAKRRRRTSTPPPPAEAAPAQQHAGSVRGRGRARRVQTSISLTPQAWDTLDELAEHSSSTTSELLTAILATAMPASPEEGFALLERLLTTTGDDGQREERNFRMPLELRAQLDRIAKTLGRPRARSQLVRAIVAASPPDNAEQARALVTGLRLRAMREAMAASATD